MKALRFSQTGSMWLRLRQFTAQPGHARGLAEAGLAFVRLDTIHLFQDTPSNSVTFAGTGSGGVHFGFVRAGGTPLDRSPIVLTAPLADDPHHIVAGSLAEFLHLGCRQGWSSLEQLAYDRAWALNWYASRNAPAFGVLDTMSRVFRLAPWPDVAGRLAQLRRAHLGELLFQPAPAQV